MLCPRCYTKGCECSLTEWSHRADKDLLHRTLRDKFPAMTFEVACFQNTGEIDTKPLLGSNRLPVCEEMVLLQDNDGQEGVDYYAVYLYSDSYISYRSVLQQLETTLSHTKDNTHSLQEVREVTSTNNPHSLRRFELVWVKKPPPPPLPAKA